MKRVVARFRDEEDAAAAEAALRTEGLEPERPAFDAPFFDPTARMPEARGVAAGALLGAVAGFALFMAVEAGLVWLPRFSPMMSAGEYAVPTLGFGLGAAVGGFLGGVIGTLRPVPEPPGPAVAVAAPDDRVAGVEEALRRHGAVAVESTVTYHENPGP